LPVSRVSISAISAFLARRMSAVLRRMRPRSAPVIADQTLKPALAASTARSMSTALACSISASVSPVAGSTLVKRSLDVAATKRPPIWFWITP